MLCAIFESKFNFQRRRAGLLPPRKCTSGRGAGRGSAPESEMTGWPPQQASSAMTMRAGQPAQAAEHRGPGVAAGLAAPALACPLPLASAQRGRKASGDEALKAYTAGQRHESAFPRKRLVKFCTRRFRVMPRLPTPSDPGQRCLRQMRIWVALRSS